MELISLKICNAKLNISMWLRLWTINIWYTTALGVIYLNLKLKVRLNIYLQSFLIFSHKVSLKFIDVLNIMLCPLSSNSRYKFLTTKSIQANISWLTVTPMAFKKTLSFFANHWRWTFSVSIVADSKSTHFLFANQSLWTQPVIIVASCTGWNFNIML